MKIMLLSNMDYLGAGNAAKKIFSMLKEEKVDVDFFVKKKKFKLSKILKLSMLEKISVFFFDIFNFISDKLLNNKISRNFNPYHKSLGWFNSPYPAIINKSNYEIIQLNWINNFLSINDILKIDKPLVWRLSDMWPILGINHYEYDNSNNFLFSALEKFNLYKKKKLLNKKIKIIAPSFWIEKKIAEKIKESNWSVETIYTPIDDKIFKPLTEHEILLIKKKYNIDENQKILCFCADDINDNRKGLSKIKKIFESDLINEKVLLLTIGKNKSNEENLNNLNIRNLGYLNSSEEINKIFNISDFLILFSEIDNLPQVGLEAQMAGLPVITFKHSGLAEIIEDNKTGFYVEDNSLSISNKLKELLKIPSNDIKKIREEARKRSKSLWSKKIVFNKYISLYKKLVDKNEN